MEEVGFAVTLAPVVEFRAVDGLHVYVFAPPAVSTVDCPSQIVGDGETAITGNRLTVTVTCAVAVHPFRSPVMVYVMVAAGLAVTFEPVVELNAVAGLHVYVFAPLAESGVDCPMQMVGDGVTESTGSGLTVTVTWAVEVHPFTSPVTVYEVVDDGLALTLEPVVVFNAVEGLHVYVFAPLAANVVDCPLQIVVDGETETTGKGFTVTVTWAVEVHPSELPVTV